nr:endocuticle structural glycoprotein ABD-4-like [Penaeus vannamei]
MKFLILACVAAVAVAAPQYSYGVPSAESSEEVAAPQTSYGAPRADSSEEVEFVPILKDDRVHEEDGTFNFDFEAANGIRFSQAGSPDGDDDAVIKAGEYSYTAPDGTEVHVKYVADENGFQPQSDLLPVAPEFPHRSLSSSSTRSPSPPRRTPPAPAPVMIPTKLPPHPLSTAAPTKFIPKRCIYSIYN